MMFALRDAPRCLPSAADASLLRRRLCQQRFTAVSELHVYASQICRAAPSALVTQHLPENAVDARRR